MLLSIETSQRLCSTAILDMDGHFVDQIVIDELNQHSKNLPIICRELLKNNGLAFESLNCIAISQGPGSYTGLRIGASYAKGLCFGLDVPLVAVSTLQAMSWQVETIDKQEATCYVPMIDARRMEVYWAAYQKNTEICVEKAEILNKEFFLKWEQKCYFFGNGAEKIPSDWLLDHHEIISNIRPMAKEIAFLAYQKFRNQDFVFLDSFEPSYIKSFHFG